LTLLVLFDVDGTLFVTHDPLAGDAMSETLEERFGVALPPDAGDRVDHRGQTTLRIARLVLRKAGLEDAEIDRGLAGSCARFTERYLELLREADTSGWRSAAGAEDALSRLSSAGLRLALLTGNPEPMARARMERLRLARFFAQGDGAFGCDAEARAELYDLARSRAGGWPVEATVAVGDTAREVGSAHARGIRSIALRTAGQEDEDLDQADAVCGDLAEAASQLLAWAG
jgi:phosphoglycolate phosphatase-like HAD superfamily hydrolase